MPETGLHLTVEVYADVICPWCYIGKRRLEAALAQLDAADRARVRVVWRSVELGQENRTPAGTAAEMLAEMWGDRAQARIEMIRALGADEGLELNLELARPVRTFDAHRVIQFAAAHGVGDHAVERLLRGYHTEGLDIADHEVLARLGTDAGLDAGAVRDALAGDAWAAAVRADQRRAAEVGVSGVPSIAVGGGPPTSGLRASIELRRMLVHGLTVLDAQAAPAGTRRV